MGGNKYKRKIKVEKCTKNKKKKGKKKKENWQINKKGKTGKIIK